MRRRTVLGHDHSRRRQVMEGAMEGLVFQSRCCRRWRRWRRWRTRESAVGDLCHRARPAYGGGARDDGRGAHGERRPAWRCHAVKSGEWYRRLVVNGARLSVPSCGCCRRPCQHRHRVHRSNGAIWSHEELRRRNRAHKLRLHRRIAEGDGVSREPIIVWSKESRRIFLK